MRMLGGERSSIAWFKLADFVARGEKERALSVQRLLMHSVVQETALMYQLEGDILIAFNDDAAFDRYHIAANFYKKSGKIKEAISVYEHASLFKQDEKILEALLDAYVLLEHKIGILETFSKLAKLCLSLQRSDFLSDVLYRNLVQLNKPLQALLCSRHVRSLLLYDTNNPNITEYMYQTLDVFHDAVATSNLHEADLQKFLIDLKILSEDRYKKAELYLQGIQ